MTYNLYRTGKIKAFWKIVEILNKNCMSVIKGVYVAFKDRRRNRFPYRFMANTNYITKKETYMNFNEYVMLGMRLNDFSFRDVLNKKSNHFKRFPQFMGRNFLDLNEATEDEINNFINNNEKFVGKRNAAGGIGFKVYTNTDSNILEKIKSDKIDCLEGYILQHNAFSEMNPSSVNTVRIHTVRTTEGCKVYFYPKVRIGKLGALLDIGWKNGDNESYRLVLNHDGKIKDSFVYTDMIYPCDVHLGTKYMFTKGKKLPFIKEAEKLCISAAEKVPEFRFIGWDVAITSTGPIIVEGNVLSGAWGDTLETISYYMDGEGARSKKEELFHLGMENIVYDSTKHLKSVSLADLSYLESPNATPNTLQQFLILLQSAVHNYGVEFFEVNSNNANCSIVFDEVRNQIVINGTRYVNLPNNIPDDIYEADRQARNSAKKVYEILRRGTDCDGSIY